MPYRKLTVRLQAAIGLDRALLSRVPKTLRSCSDREPIIRLGERPSHCALLVEGFAMRQKVVADIARAARTDLMASSSPALGYPK